MIALVAGATRGTGRGIAVALGAAGATVYCAGRSVRGQRSEMDRPETIEETAGLVTAAGGTGIPARADFLDPEQVAELAARVRREQGRLDVLVNDVWGGDHLWRWNTPVWEHDQDKGLRLLRPAFAWSHELRPYGGTAVAVTPGFLRSEAMLDNFGVTEDNWRQAQADSSWMVSETPAYVGRGVAALARDPGRQSWSGRSVSSEELALAYGLTDVDGSRPRVWSYITEVREKDGDTTSWAAYR